MTTAEDDPLWFLSFDSLLLIVFDAKLWKLFHPFLTTKTLLRAKFDELMPVRHRIAHARSIHKDDLTRVEHLMRDVDQGFLNFVTSYNKSYFFYEGRLKDPVYKFVAEHRLNKHGRVRADIGYSIRPWVLRGLPANSVRAPGVFYQLRFGTDRSQEYFDFPDIVARSTGGHRHVLHIILDLDQTGIRVTIPAMHEEAATIDMIDRFYGVFSSCTTRFPKLPVTHFDESEGRL